MPRSVNIQPIPLKKCENVDERQYFSALIFIRLNRTWHRVGKQKIGRRLKMSFFLSYLFVCCANRPTSEIDILNQTYESTLFVCVCVVLWMRIVRNFVVVVVFGLLVVMEFFRNFFGRWWLQMLIGLLREISSRASNCLLPYRSILLWLDKPNRKEFKRKKKVYGNCIDRLVRVFVLNRSSYDYDTVNGYGNRSLRGWEFIL